MVLLNLAAAALPMPSRAVATFAYPSRLVLELHHRREWKGVRRIYPTDRTIPTVGSLKELRCHADQDSVTLNDFERRLHSHWL